MSKAKTLLTVDLYKYFYPCFQQCLTPQQISCSCYPLPGERKLLSHYHSNDNERGKKNLHNLVNGGAIVAFINVCCFRFNDANDLSNDNVVTVETRDAVKILNTSFGLNQGQQLNKLACGFQNSQNCLGLAIKAKLVWLLLCKSNASSRNLIIFPHPLTPSLWDYHSVSSGQI